MRFQCMLTVAGFKSAIHSQMTKMTIRGATHAHDLTLSACTSVSVMIKLSALCAVCNYAHTSAHPERTVQEQYEAVCKKLFDDLDKLEKRLDGQRYLIPYYPGGRATPCPTLADYRLFTTLIRFDIAYYPLFKTNLKHIRDYPNLQVKPQCPLSALRRTQLCFTWMLRGQIASSFQTLLAPATAVCRMYKGDVLAKLWRTVLGNNQPFMHTTEMNNVCEGSCLSHITCGWADSACACLSSCFSVGISP